MSGGGGQRIFTSCVSRMDDMKKTDFFGVSGAVKFDELGNRMSKVVVEQLRSKFSVTRRACFDICRAQMVTIIVWRGSMRRRARSNG